MFGSETLLWGWQWHYPGMGNTPRADPSGFHSMESAQMMFFLDVLGLAAVTPKERVAWPPKHIVGSLWGCPVAAVTLR